MGANTQNHRTLNPLKLIAKGDYVAVLPVCLDLGCKQTASRQLRNEKPGPSAAPGHTTQQRAMKEGAGEER